MCDDENLLNGSINIYGYVENENRFLFKLPAFEYRNLEILEFLVTLCFVYS